jgi:iron complex transport system permease protein
MKNSKVFFLLSLGILILSMIANISFGAVSISPKSILSGIYNSAMGLSREDLSTAEKTIILDIRLPHTVLIVIVGAALSISGAAYQGLLKNPLADPYLIGVASGAGFGAVVGMYIRSAIIIVPFGSYFIPICAMLGGILTVFIVFKISSVGNVLPITTLILAGIALGSLFSAGTSLILLKSDGQVYQALAFLLGGSLVAGWEPIFAAFPFIGIGIFLLIYSGYSLNVMQFGEAQALQLGVNVPRIKFFVIVGATVCTAVSVAFTGVIGFVGLVVPHILRIIIGSDYKNLLLFSLTSGGIFILWVDLIARYIIAPLTLPLGIVTAFIGAPFFLWVLGKAKNEVFW